MTAVQDRGVEETMLDPSEWLNGMTNFLKRIAALGWAVCVDQDNTLEHGSGDGKSAARGTLNHPV